jgi:cytochrome b561/polyisoprenoid-binding protein YceI
MSRTNSATSYGLVARAFHWLTALVILSAIPLGIIANDMAVSGETMALKTQLFSLHKTIGVAAFGLGLARIIWALSQTKPLALHPERRLETFVAELVHWLLYLSLVIVPLSGWIHHAAVDGFAPILWPFGQGLPFVPKSESVASAAAGLHWVFTKVLVVSILLHIAGALKHHLIDRDDTVRRMTRGTHAPVNAMARKGHIAPFFLALAIYGAGAAFALSLGAETAEQAAAPIPAATTNAGNWQVQQGNLAFSVSQMGAMVEGSFDRWTAAITHDDTITTGQTGRVEVDIDMASLTIGSVTEQAKGSDFLNVGSHPTARFTADLFAEPAGHIAKGTLTLHGMEQAVSFPFALTIEGDTAQMTGSVTLDRRDFGVGAAYADEATVGFAVTVTIALTAQRVD